MNETYISCKILTPATEYHSKSLTTTGVSTKEKNILIHLGLTEINYINFGKQLVDSLLLSLFIQCLSY